MFGLFKSRSFQDSQLGLLAWRGGYWKGTVGLGLHGAVELRLSGGYRAPDPTSLSLAQELPARFDALVPQIQAGLVEHLQPYQEAASAVELSARSEAFARIKRAEDVWRNVSPIYVLIHPLRGAPKDGPTIEIAYAVAWEEEHKVAARIQGWEVFELCGSVL